MTLNGQAEAARGQTFQAKEIRKYKSRIIHYRLQWKSQFIMFFMTVET